MITEDGASSSVNYINSLRSDHFSCGDVRWDLPFVYVYVCVYVCVCCVYVVCCVCVCVCVCATEMMSPYTKAQTLKTNTFGWMSKEIPPPPLPPLLNGLFLLSEKLSWILVKIMAILTRMLYILTKIQDSWP